MTTETFHWTPGETTFHRKLCPLLTNPRQSTGDLSTAAFHLVRPCHQCLRLTPEFMDEWLGYIKDHLAKLLAMKIEAQITETVAEAEEELAWE